MHELQLEPRLFLYTSGEKFIEFKLRRINILVI